MEDFEYGKLFVGGLSWETTQDNLQRYFSRYGEVIDCVVMKNAESGRSRGFGFVTFAEPANVNVVLQNGPHTLDGRTIDPKPCNPRTLQKPKKGGGYPKVFLGGLPSNVTETDLRSFFTRFGKVMEVVIMYDQEKKKSRGFGFLSFEDDEAVDRCVAEHFVNLNGKQVEIKKAEPRDGSGGNKMGGNDGSSAWGPPQAPMGMMQGPNGQMGGPPMNMGAPMGPNMNQGYLGWGTSPQQQYNAGYGTPSGPGSYQGWGAPPAPQGPPPQWGNSYGGPPTQQGYGSYGSSAASWNNWNMPQNGGSTGPSGYMATTGDVYSRAGQSAGATPSGPPGTAPTAGSASKPGSDYGPASYGSAYGSYSEYSARSTAPYGAADSTGGYSSQPPQAAGSLSCYVIPSELPTLPIPTAPVETNSLMSTPRSSLQTTAPVYCPTPTGGNKVKGLTTSPGYAQSAAAGDCYSGGPQRNSYGTPNSQAYHPYRR
ncbi:heterogeneous nuclear ribonucleoprotein 27C isoform X3 [Anthonomus grandis grandis]|uniref:heterogeneous nuclear ribonucleoprotein 27C isoform X3 n=1 Tax=Anthonomus grandis grandis TaxID=2921223 RepID=UPI002165C848|nr:heterogeneous nuclear ribonucleoprotein 27C isoform X3 [Anthonomus grandis grandis]